MGFARRLLFAGIAIVALACAAAANPAPGIDIGDPPPALAPMAWVKGQPITSFELGRVYVVEFFATWCGSSRQAMPRLSKWAKERASDLTVVGVVIREGERAQPTVEAVTDFVDKRGDEMAYTVAMDDPKLLAMYQAWMAASGMHGIPTAFIIGRDGRIAYVGYMMDDAANYTFETALADALSGRSDLEAARVLHADVKRQTTERLRETRLLQPLRDARARGDERSAIEEAEKVMAAYPDLQWQAFSSKFGALLTLDESKALAFAREQSRNEGMRAAVNASDDKIYWSAVGRLIAGEKNLSKSTYSQGAAYLQSAAQIEDSIDQILLGRLYALSGDFERAVIAQERAIAAARKSGEVPSDSIAKFEATLARYRNVRDHEARQRDAGW